MSRSHLLVGREFVLQFDHQRELGVFELALECEDRVEGRDRAILLDVRCAEQRREFLGSAGKLPLQAREFVLCAQRVRLDGFPLRIGRNHA